MADPLISGGTSLYGPRFPGLVPYVKDTWYSQLGGTYLGMEPNGRIRVGKTDGTMDTVNFVPPAQRSGYSVGSAKDIYTSAQPFDPNITPVQAGRPASLWQQMREAQQSRPITQPTAQRYQFSHGGLWDSTNTFGPTFGKESNYSAYPLPSQNAPPGVLPSHPPPAPVVAPPWRPPLGTPPDMTRPRLPPGTPPVTPPGPGTPPVTPPVTPPPIGTYPPSRPTPNNPAGARRTPTPIGQYPATRGSPNNPGGGLLGNARRDGSSLSGGGRAPYVNPNPVTAGLLRSNVRGPTQPDVAANTSRGLLGTRSDSSKSAAPQTQWQAFLASLTPTGAPPNQYGASAYTNSAGETMWSSAENPGMVTYNQTGMPQIMPGIYLRPDGSIADIPMSSQGTNAAAPFGMDDHGNPFSSAAQAADWRSRVAARDANLGGLTFDDVYAGKYPK